MSFVIPTHVVGMQLHRISGEKLIACESMRFASGAAAVDTALRRAAISGRVELEGKLANHFADLLDADEDIVATVALDRNSYRALKTRWMRCKVDKGE